MGIKRRVKGLLKAGKATVPPVVNVVDGKLLHEKNVLITGGAQNIGKSIACEMAAQGANVFFTDIDREAIKQTEGVLAAFPVRSKGFPSDVSIETENTRLCELLEQDGISIDILVNNVGQNLERNRDFDLILLRRTFDLNFFGPAHLTQLIANRMKEQARPGSIIFISSIHQWSVNLSPAYSASKGALSMLIKELAIRFAPDNIRINGIAPAWVKGDSEAGSYKYAPLYQRGIDPRYIGRAAVFLASDYFSLYTTGTVMTVDAGTLLYNHRVDQQE